VPLLVVLEMIRALESVYEIQRRQILDAFLRPLLQKPVYRRKDGPIWGSRYGGQAFIS